MERRLIKKPSFIFKALKEKSWGTITVSKDEQIEHWLESMPAGSETCPTWYSVRLFKGTETNPGHNKEPEYWLGICMVFLAPFLPIPIISDEIVIKLGDNLGLYNELYNKYGSHFAHEIMYDTGKHFHKIINKATVKFTECNIKYNNDSIWSAY
jgi:hypothetical protein